MHCSSLSAYVLILVLLFGGCSAMDAEEPVPEKLVTDFSRFSQDSTLLVGKWRWTQTVCCFGNLGVETPQSTGETETLVLTPNDTVEVYRNETLAQRTALEDYLNRAQWGVTEDSLVVSWAYIDGPQRIYVRPE